MPRGRVKMQRHLRAASVPPLTYPEDLPVAQRRNEIARLIRDNRVVVLCGETGSGKTTQLPKICLGLGRGIDGMIGHTQPRRIAARAVAARVAQELGTPLGETVGYKIRFGDKTSPRSLVKLMTDGILLAETQSDRDLLAYDTIIIDEAHERSLNIDFLLGYLHRLLPKRPDLRLIITSATIDPQRFSSHFAGAPIIEVEGRTYPVEVRHRPAPPGDDVSVYEQVLAALDELPRDGDVLVFMPGEREIRQTAETLRRKHLPRFPNTELLPLYARLSTAEQQRVFLPHRGRRIVISTNVAETSLTVPGIRYVIDPGTARLNRYSPRSGVQRLEVEPISRASGDQRAGRCGRVAPGICVRLYDDEDTRPEHTDPEIVRSNLAAVILQMAALRLGDPAEFPFIDPPDPRLIRDGYDTLAELGAVDSRRRLTDLGRRLARLPVDPRLGRMVLAGDAEHCLREMLVIASALAVQDPRERPLERRDEADECHAHHADERSDFVALLNLWDFYHDLKERLSVSQLRKACRQNFLSFMRLREWVDVHRQLRELAREFKLRANVSPAEYDRVHRALLTGLLGFVGRLSDNREYVGTGATRFSIHPASGLFGQSPKWLVAAELVRTTRLYARDVAVVRPEWIEHVGEHLVKRTHTEPQWDERRGHAICLERVTIHGLELAANRRVPLAPIDPGAARSLFIHHALVEEEGGIRAPFLDHNRALLDDVRTLEAKTRRTDLVADVNARFAFYDARLGPDVHDARSLNAWRADAERDDRRILFMTRDDLLVGETSGITPDAYPDSVVHAGQRLAIDYRLAPGESDDGVSLTVPVEHLERVNEQRLAWLVPGQLREKIVELVRALPKDLRRAVGPAPRFADEFLAATDFGEGSLLDALREHVGRKAGALVPPGVWREEDLPEHMRVRVRVADAKGRELDADRDLGALRDRLKDRVRSAIARAAGNEFALTGLDAWDFGELPESVERRGVRGFPALIDEGESVGLTVVESPDLAERLTRRGVRRLFVLAVKRDLRHLLDHLPGTDRLRLLFAPLGRPEQLRSVLADTLARRVFTESRPIVRTKEAFDARLEQGWGTLSERAHEAADLFEQILRARQSLAAAVEPEPAPEARNAVADVRAQLSSLFGTGGASLPDTPWVWLSSFPRYLNAASRRLEKLRRSPDHDRASMTAVLEQWSRCVEAYGRQDPRAEPPAQLELYRWMIEELRVSLWAQELRTAVPVSPKRLEQQWQLAQR